MPSTLNPPTTDVPRWERLAINRLIPLAFGMDRRAGPWADGPVAERIVVESTHGTRLLARWYPTPAATPKGVVVAIHPDKRYGGHYFVRSPWLELLHEAGLDVVTFDLPGYGPEAEGHPYYHEHAAAVIGAVRHHAGALPVHVLGVSLGAYVAVNALALLAPDEVSGVVLESPYPTFRAWYGAGPFAALLGLFERTFRRTYRAIDAERNAAELRAARVLVGIAGGDEVTTPTLSQRVARALPEGARVLEIEGLGHLQLVGASATFREAVLETFGAMEDEANLGPITTKRGLGSPVLEQRHEGRQRAPPV